MRRATIFFTAVFILIITASCVGVFSRLFQTGTGDNQCVDQFCFQPRIVSYQDHLGKPENMGDNNFWISIKVRDTAVIQPDRIRDGKHVAERKEAGDRFKDRMLELFRFDSLVLRIGDEETSQLLLPDTSKYTPRDIDYLSYNFGQAIIPLDVYGLKAVFYYRYFGREDSSAGTDSVVYGMDRVESGVTLLGLKRVVPQRIIPQPEE